MRHLLLLLVCTLLLWGAGDKVEIFAGEIQTHGNSVSISGDVVVVYKEYILTAQRAKYDKQSGVLELFGNVKVSSNKKYKILGSYAKLDIRNKERLFKPFYMLEEKSNVWLSAEKGCAKNDDIDITSGVLSGCDPKDPLWQIEFSSSDYNAKTKWLNLYNTVLYIYDIPVFYTPYFGYSLDTTRRTGLLTPSLGYSNAEGLFFEQPLFIAEQNWWDLELKPQIRTLRGSGLYGVFRFVDSKVSKGELKFGYFKEQESYYLANNLANKSHYGVNFDYENMNLLESWFGIDAQGQSVLYVQTNNMNDVDYINLSTNDTTKNVTASQTISRVNLFYNTQSDYIATYMKYYVDLTLESNAATIQQLPSLHYHRYLDTLLNDHLLYNFNIKSTNLYRQEGSTAVQTDLDIPLKLRTSLFDEYLNVAYETKLYGQYTDFQNEANMTSPYEDGYFVRNSHQFTLSTQLTKPYAEHTHTIELSASYIKSGYEKGSGFYEQYKGIDCADPANSDICSFYKISPIQEALTLDFSQYLYDTRGKQVLYHRLSDIITDPGKGSSSVGELESELDVWLSDSVRFYNDMLYNFTYDRFSKQFNKLSYKGHGFDAAVSHFYKKNFADNSTTSYVTASLKYRYNAHYSYSALYDYDLELKTKKKAEIGFLYEKRCWNFGLRYAENNRPILTNNNQASSIYDRYIYFTVVLKPLMKPTASNFFGLRLPSTMPAN